MQRSIEIKVRFFLKISKVLVFGLYSDPSLKQLICINFAISFFFLLLHRNGQWCEKNVHWLVSRRRRAAIRRKEQVNWGLG